MGFSTRIKNSFVGMLIGLLLIPGSIVLHAWNEYRTIHRSRGLQEAVKVVVSLPDVSQAAPEHNGDLVHLSGRADTEEFLTDEVFGIRSNAIRLARQVEMYQWVEDKDENDEGTEIYSYDLKWAADQVDSSSFDDPGGHENPSPKYLSKQHTASQVHIGVFQINSKLTHSIDAWSPIEMNESAIMETVGRSHPEQFRVYDNQIYWSEVGPDPEEAVLGDLRIRFEHVLPTEVSFVSGLKGQTFEPYSTSNGEQIERLFLGILSAEEVMQKLVTENTVFAWVLRIGGLILCVIGFSLVLGPIKSLVSWIPLLGDLAGGALFLVGALLALIVSLTTIAIAWIAVRPLLAIALLAVVALACYMIFKMRRSPHEEPPLVDASMFVDS